MVQIYKKYNRAQEKKSLTAQALVWLAKLKAPVSVFTKRKKFTLNSVS